jgi:hypothetical protein
VIEEAILCRETPWRRRAGKLGLSQQAGRNVEIDRCTCGDCADDQLLTADSS